MSVSIGIQSGVPLETYVDQFTFTRFEPQGTVEGHPNVKLATSIVDYMFRVLGVEYLNRYDLAHVKPEETQTPVASALDVPEMKTVSPTLAHTKGATARSAAMSETLEPATSSLDAHLDAMMGDAPVCDVCGHITVRNGACYKCLNCGNSMGCS